MKILIIGGNRFVGLRVSMALDKIPETELHILNRTGQTAHVKNAILHKGDRVSLMGSYLNRDWDIVLDFAGFTAEHARESIKFFKTVQRYIFISSASVYDNKSPRFELSFDPTTWKILSEPTAQDKVNPFQFGKRQAEAVFSQEAHFPVAQVRFPFILGLDDYTRRLDFHFERVRDRKPIYLPNPKAQISMIHSEDAAKFLLWTLKENYVGPVNIASPEGLGLMDLLNMIEAATGQQALLVKAENEDNHSPYGVDHDSVMDVKKVQALGYKPKSLMSWLPELIASLGGADQSSNTRLH
jgi:nucleoside-diphosphate-sugar epimerase